jgi:hypothetical protein
VLGGHGLGLATGTPVEVVFSHELIRLRAPGDLLIHASGRLAELPYADLVAFEIGGPGARQTGGGFIGGGFGLTGAAEGMLIATALNMLTTRTRIDTVICLQTKSAELFLHYGDEAPDALRIRLSEVFNILRENVSAGPQQGTSTGEHVVERLAKLADMLDRELLTREEFDRLKAELL